MRAAILGLVAATTVAGAVGTAFLPYLLVRYPALLLLCSAEPRNIVLVAPDLDLPTTLALATPRRSLGMLATWGIGVLYGRVLYAWSARRLPRLARTFAWVERQLARVPRLSLVLWPFYTPSMFAGVARMPLCRYVPWMMAGQIGYVVVFHRLGAALTRWTDRLVELLSAHLWESTAVCVALVGLSQLVNLVRRRRERAAARSLP